MPDRWSTSAEYTEYYKSYTAHLNRFSPYAENKNFNLVMVQQVIKGSIKPIKPLDVLIYNLKWEVGFTSKIYLWCRRTFKIKWRKYVTVSEWRAWFLASLNLQTLQGFQNRTAI